MHFSLIFLLIVLPCFSSAEKQAGFKNGAPCKMQHTLKADRKEHGPPEEDGDPPYEFSVKDENGNLVTYYEPNTVYTVEIVGRSRFRGLILQPRLATRTGFIIGHLRGGRFIKDKTWDNYGVKIHDCRPNFHNSLTHKNFKAKVLIRVKWITERFVGPIQFYMTIFKEKKKYWERWQPISGFLLPKPRFQETTTTTTTTEVPETTVQETTTTTTTTEVPETTEATERSKKRPGDFRKLAAKLPDTDAGSQSKLVIFTDPPEYYPEGDEYYEEGAAYYEGDEYYGHGDGAEYYDGEEHKEKPGSVDYDISAQPEKVQVAAKPVRPAESVKPVPAVKQATKPVPTTTTKPVTTTTKRDYCDPNPCYSGGTCVNIEVEEYDEPESQDPLFDSGEADDVEQEAGGDGSAEGEPNFYCECSHGWTGQTCLEEDHCAEHKCQNGVCKNGKFGYTCECYNGWASQYCDRECPDYLCEQGGTCIIDDGGEYGCMCRPGTTGARCDQEVDECASNPCQNGATCIDKFNKYICECDVGYMGKNCHRACQDIYKTCDLWRRQDHCVVSKHTTFFDINCPRSCSNFRTDTPIPPVLEPLEFLIGIWESNVTTNTKFPFNFKQPEDATYYETLTFLVTKPPMFGTPFLNYSSVAVNNENPEDVQITRGFLSIRTRPKNPRRIGLMTTGNYGVTLIEEGPLEDEAIILRPQYISIHSRAQHTFDKEVEREYKLDGAFLREKITKPMEGGDVQEVYKYFYKTKGFDIY